jgi:hypothetical protein
MRQVVAQGVEVVGHKKQKKMDFFWIRGLTPSDCVRASRFAHPECRPRLLRTDEALLMDGARADAMLWRKIRTGDGRLQTCVAWRLV